jgi:putative nucleotidyltransferase with HDIG domain
VLQILGAEGRAVSDIKGRSLLYITENSHSFEFRAFAKALKTEAVGAHELSREHLRLDPNLVVDVDLRSNATVKRLRQVLAVRGTGCRIFLVDPHAPEAAAHARALGADKILPTHSDPQSIHLALREHFELIAGPEVTHSIEAGVTALDGGFRTLLRDEIFDTAGMENACDQIIDAIDSAGVDDWINTVRGYHVGTFQHCLLVTATASSFARQLGMRRSDVVKITAAALVHDIGKAAVPLEILDKTGPLTEAEMQAMRQHPAIGHSYLASKSRIAADALSSVRSHHEYLDGSGYPDGLRDAEIDDITRIITISDIYAALIERRAYKPPKRPEEALGVLESMAQAGKVELALVRAFGRIALQQQAA